MSEEPLLRPEEISGVLSADETPDATAAGPEAAKPYSLREPLAIPPEQEPLVVQKLERLTAVLREAFEELAGTEIDLQLDGMQQQRAAAALSVVPPPVWVLAVRARSGGLALALHPIFALTLVDMALGGPGTPADEGREPTAVEARILGRLIASSAPRLGEVVGQTLTPVDLQVGAVSPAVAAPGETVATGLLRIRLGETDHTSLLLGGAALLAPAAAASPAGARRPPGPVAPRVERVPVETRPVLRAGRVSLADLTALEPGKLLLLDASAEAVLELRTSGSSNLWGRIVREDERPVFSVQRRRGWRKDDGERSDE
jgi:flagellar motor switch protein FliM